MASPQKHCVLIKSSLLIINDAMTAPLRLPPPASKTSHAVPIQQNLVRQPVMVTNFGAFFLGPEAVSSANSEM